MFNFKHDKKGYKIYDKPKNFVMGVSDIFQLQNTNDIVVTGRVKGTIHTGYAVYFSNPGMSDDVVLTTIVGIETAPNVKVRSASDCHVRIRLEKGKLFNIKKGTVLFSRNTSLADAHSAYTDALFETYVIRQNMELTDKDIEELSITDCAEIWRMFLLFHSKSAQAESKDVKQENRRKLDILCAALCKKILEADVIYYVHSKDTDEPYLFSRTIRKEDGSYVCTPPSIMLITDAYKKVMSSHYSNDRLLVIEVSNGEAKDGIYNFLEEAFYVNGACGVNILSELTAIEADMLIPASDYSNVSPQDDLIANPDLRRWMLLLEQLGQPEGEEEEAMCELYYHFMSMEMAKARFLTPILKDGEIESEHIKTVYKKDANINLPAIKGLYGRPAIHMYTDWKLLMRCFGTKWNVLVMTIEDMIATFDCVINITCTKSGCYISAKTFEKIKKIADNGKNESV